MSGVLGGRGGNAGELGERGNSEVVRIGGCPNISSLIGSLSGSTILGKGGSAGGGSVLIRPCELCALNVLAPLFVLALCQIFPANVAALAI